MENKSPQDLQTRTSDFALRIVKLYSSLPKTTEAQVLGKQVLRSGTSVGANYREGHRAKSDSDIVNQNQKTDGQNLALFSSFILHNSSLCSLTNPLSAS